MLQSISSVFVVYRRKTLTGSPDPTHANGTDKPCIFIDLEIEVVHMIMYVVANKSDRRSATFYFISSRILDERNLVSSLAIQINQFKKASIKRRFECSPPNEQWQFFTQEQPLKMLYFHTFFVCSMSILPHKKYHLILVLD